MEQIQRRSVDEQFLDGLLGLESSKVGFYAEVKQKIQELEQTNLDLRIKRNELQAIFDAIPDSVMIYNARSRVESCNHVCPLKFPDGSGIGSPCASIFHPDAPNNEAACPVDRALQGEGREAYFSRHLSDREFFFEATATPILDGYGKPTRALVFLRDVTDRKHQEMKLHQTAKMSSIGMLAAGVAHEINNPLTSVAGYAEALQRRLSEHPELVTRPELEAFPRYLDIIMREAYRCKAIIESLLSFSRKPQSARDAVELEPLIHEVLELLRHRTRAENVDICEDLADELPPVHGDPNGLRQVILNLVMNAIQAVDGGGQVRIATHLEGEEVRLCVSDTGSGIPAEKLDQIWDPFFTTKGVREGLGLGLSVTYNIVQKHAGHIDVHSIEGEGTRFTVGLPRYGTNP